MHEENLIRSSSTANAGIHPPMNPSQLENRNFGQLFLPYCLLKLQRIWVVIVKWRTWLREKRSDNLGGAGWSLVFSFSEAADPCKAQSYLIIRSSNLPNTRQHPPATVSHCTTCLPPPLAPAGRETMVQTQPIRTPESRRPTSELSLNWTSVSEAGREY